MTIGSLDGVALGAQPASPMTDPMLMAMAAIDFNLMSTPKV